MSDALFWILGFFAVFGALDRIFGNQYGLGREFENGLQAMGSLMLAMAGIVTLAPILAAGLKPVVVPVFKLLGADPAMFAGSILACDMGGGSLARELTNDPRAAALGGVITGSMLGATGMVNTTVAPSMDPVMTPPRAAALGSLVSSLAREPPPISQARMEPANMAGSAPRNLKTGTTTGFNPAARMGARVTIPAIASMREPMACRPFSNSLPRPY